VRKIDCAVQDSVEGFGIGDQRAGYALFNFHLAAGQVCDSEGELVVLHTNLAGFRHAMAQYECMIADFGGIPIASAFTACGKSKEHYHCD